MPEKPPQKTPKPAPPGHFQPVTEDELSDNQLVSLLEAEGDPFATLKAAGKAAGLPEQAVTGLIRRLRAQYGEVTEELKNLHSGQIATMLTDKATLALSYIDDYTLAQSSAKDCAIIVGILLVKRQLLRGEPTQIISVEERQGLDELAKAIMGESERRGLLIDLEPSEVTIVEPSQERATRPRSGGNKRITERKTIMANVEKDRIGEPR